MKKRNISEWIIFIGSLIAVLVTFLTAIEKLKGFVSTNLGFELTPERISMMSEILNIGILVLFYWIIKAKDLEFNSEDEVKKFARALNIEDAQYRKAHFNIDRVNKLVDQITFCLAGFMLFLIFFYVIEIVEDIKPAWSNRIHSDFPFLEFLENFSNVVSAAFLYLAFNVLYDITLDSKNRPKIYYKGTSIFLIAFIGFYVLFLLTEDPGSKSEINATNIFRLICGVYNGLAMGLLFGRFVSMEYFFKDLDLNKHNKFSKKFYYFGTIFILPLYVIAQPMFGVFKLVGLGNPLLFKAIVFLVCFIGKTFFLYLFYNYVNKRWFHVYLHIILANHTIPKDIANNFPQIEDG